MPALGNRGPIAPRELAAAKTKAAPPIAKLPGVPSKITLPAATVEAQHPLLRLTNQAKAQSQLPRSFTRSQVQAGGTPLTKLRLQAQQKSTKAVRASRQAALPRQPASGGGLLGTILNLPARVEEQGYKNIATVTGVPGLSKVGNLAAEAINLPVQTLPAAYHLGKGLGELTHGKTQELHEIGRQLVSESPIAHVLKGDFGGAVQKIGEHPLGSALEVSGGLAAVDRTLGAVGRLSGSEAARLADPGATTISRAPRELVPGGASQALRPYDKGLVRKMAEQKISEKPLSADRVSAKLKQHYDRTEASLLRISRSSRAKVLQMRDAAIKTGRGTGRRTIPGVDAVTPHAQWLADPSVMNEHGTPLHRDQLSEMVEHLAQPSRDELPQEAQAREDAMRHYQALLENQRYEANPQPAYSSALKLAQEKRALEPQLERHGVYTAQQMRAAKAIPAFQFHFRAQDPWVEPSTEPGATPFRLGGPEGKPISVDDVYKQLETKGVHESQLAFVSTRPFQNKNAPFRSGHFPGGAKTSKGHLTGSAFIRGQHDPTYEAAVRQHLTDQGIIDRANGDWYKAQSYVHTKETIAKMIERKLPTLPREQRPALRSYVRELREGAMHFEQKGNESPWQRALQARDTLKELYPHLQVEPVRTVHPYATSEYRKALGQRLAPSGENITDKLDPGKYNPEEHFWQSQFPTTAAEQHDPAAGPVGLVHSVIAQRMKDYEKDVGSANLLRMPASFWRKANVAYSVRHIPGVLQEVGGRALMNNIGLLSMLRGTRAVDEILHYAHEHPDPSVKLGGQRVEAMTKGTVAAYTEDLARHVTQNQLARSAPRLAKLADAFRAGAEHKTAGAPLRAIRGAMRAYNGVTDRVLAFERRTIEHPPQIAGAGKHYNEEFKRLSGQRLKVLGSFSDVEKAFLRGQVDQAAIDHAARTFREYWGEWDRATPNMKKAMTVSPFAQWYLNSLRFIYQTMPVHHPLKTGLLATIEAATKQQRTNEGQGYVDPFGDPISGGLESSQQGSLPFGRGWRAGQEYYTPQGAVSPGLKEAAVGAALPWLSSTIDTVRGINPLTHRPLEEIVEGSKKPITNEAKIAWLGALSLLESFVPPVRYVKTVTTARPSEKEDVLGKTLGVPPNVWQAFRPFRTAKEYKKEPEASARVRNLPTRNLPTRRLPERKLPVRQQLPERKIPTF